MLKWQKDHKAAEVEAEAGVDHGVADNNIRVKKIKKKKRRR